MNLITILLMLLFIPFVTSLNIEIYSGYTTNPSFSCPSDALRCEMYEEIDAMNRNITPPLLIKTCQPSTQCSYVNDVGSSFGFRLLPGDVSFGTGLFKGYKIVETDETTTTVNPTTSTFPITTTTISQVNCSDLNFWSCVAKPNCQWTGSMINGYCYQKGQLVTTSTIASTTTTIQTTSTITPRECVQICIHPSILGFCIFNLYAQRCN